ncbi:MAG: hypothetical protein NTW87_32050, partial [Planctomycetota bacterium]|nr:hypothetical protein [Planctomycetota bacterium]
MLWFYTYCLLPVLRVLYVPLDWLLAPVSLLSPVAALVIVGALTGLAVNLIQKYFSNQNLLGRCKADLKRLKELQRAAKQAGDKDGMLRLAALSRRVSGKYMWGSLKPSLVSVPALCVLAMWTGSRLSFDPIRPGDEIEATAYFEDGAAGFAHIVPNAGLAPVGAPIAPVAVPPAPANAPAAAAAG